MTLKPITLAVLLASTCPVAFGKNYDLAPAPLGSSLTQIAADEGIALAFDPALVRGKIAPALQGNYAPLQALDAILHGSGLHVHASADGSYTLRSNQTSPDTLESIVVVGSRAPQTIAETAAAVYYIDAETVARGAQNGKNVAQIIAQAAPSLDIPSEGRTNFAQYMRGRPVLVMIDGVSLNSSRGISRQFDSISPFNIDHIEVLSGATAVYGGNATGGIINIVSKQPQDGTLHGETAIGLTSGLRGSKDLDYRLGQSLSGGNDFIQGRVGINYEQTGSFYDGSGTRVIPDIIQGSQQHNRTLDLLSSLSVTPNDAQRLDLSAQYYDSTQDNPYTFSFGRNFAGLLGNPELIQPVEGFEADRQASTRRYQFNLNYRHDDLFAGHSFVGQLSHRHERMDFIPFIKPKYFALSASQQSTGLSNLRAALIKDAQPLTITYGIDASKEHFTSDQMLFDPKIGAQSGGVINKQFATIGRYPDIDVDEIAAFAELSYNLSDTLTLSGGYRFEHLRNSVGDFIAVDQQAYIAMGKGKSADVIPGGSNDYNVHLLNVGVHWNVTPEQQVWAKFAQGFDLPDPAKYYGRGKYQLVGDHWTLGKYTDVAKNPLAGIKTNSIELGWRLNRQALSLQTAAYFSLSDKSIELSDKDNLFIDVIDHKRRVYGLEGEGRYQLNDRWAVGGQFHISRSEEKQGDDWRRSSIVYTSAPKLGAFIDYHGNDWALRLDATSTFDVTDDDNNRLEGYTLLDLSGSYPLAGGRYGQIHFAVNNLLDNDYTTVWGQNSKFIYSRFVPEKVLDYHGRGRSYSVSYRYSF